MALGEAEETLVQNTPTVDVLFEGDGSPDAPRKEALSMYNGLTGRLSNERRQKAMETNILTDSLKGLGARDKRDGALFIKAWQKSETAGSKDS